LAFFSAALASRCSVVKSGSSSVVKKPFEKSLEIPKAWPSIKSSASHLSSFHFYAKALPLAA